MAGVAGLGFVAVLVLIGVGYAMTPVPRATQEDVLSQGSAAYYANDVKGKPLMRVGLKREIVTLDKVPEHVRTAVLAAEDRGFYSEPGVSPKGVMRAVWNNATGGDTQGGSTITQQLARNYYEGLSQERSVSRKVKEIFISIKLGKTEKKDKILENYLNTILFGRQAEGIQAASRAYFHKDVGKLNVSEGAMLGAMIQRPNYFHTTNAVPNDPAHQALVERWNYVLDGMVTMGKLPKAERDKQTFPKTQSEWNDAKKSGQIGFMEQRILKELHDLGIKDETISKGGLKIYTSLDSKWMTYAERAVKEAGPSSLPKNTKIGLVAVDPKTGEIPAFYGGDWRKSQVDAALTDQPQVGSSFKPYVLATALRKGNNVKSMIDGNSPKNFDLNGDDLPMGADGYLVKNDEGDRPNMGVINLVEATQMSVNTAYVKLAMKLGLNDVVKTATDFGVPESYLAPYKRFGGLALGIAGYPAVYQASGYAAFANGGFKVTPHVITKIVDADGNRRKLPWDKPKTTRVLEEEQAAQATYAMQAVVKYGTGRKAQLPDGRPVAGKTGTTDKNRAAWFVGYVPQLSTAVNMFTNDNKPMKNIPGYSNGVYGGDIPAAVWRTFMTKVTQGMEAKQFETPTFAGTPYQWDTPKPKAPPTPTPDPNEKCTDPRDFFKPKCRDQQPPTQTPAPGTGQPCQFPGGNFPAGCDPNKPPSEPPPKWFCSAHPEYPSCTTQQDPNNNTGSGGTANGTSTGTTTSREVDP